MLQFILFGYLIIINIAAFIIYSIDGIAPQTRVKEWLMILFPALGGSVGACLGNYFFNTNYRHLNSSFWVLLSFGPGVILIIELFCFLYLEYGWGWILYLKDIIFGHAGVVGFYFIGINLITFILQFIKGTEYFLLPYDKDGIPLRLLVCLIIIGGALGALLSKLIFNFKYSNPTNYTKRLEHFMYGIGIWLFAILWLLVIVSNLVGIVPSVQQ